MPVYHQVSGPLAAESYAEQGGEQIESPEVMGPEEDKHGNALNEQATGHDTFGAVPFRQNRSQKSAGDADQRDYRKDHRRLCQADTLLNGEWNGENQDYAMAGAPQSMNGRKVPECSGPPDMLVEHF